MSSEELSAILKSLQCPVCFEYMVDEIVLCKNGHSLCKNCKDKLTEDGCPTCKENFIVNRNRALEEIASIFSFPCRNDGCTERLSAKNIIWHERTCQSTKQHCALQFIDCQWTGKSYELKKHVQTTHKEYIDKWKFCEKYGHVYLTFHLHETFLICYKGSDDVITLSAVYMGTKKNPEDYILRVEFVDQTKRGYEFTCEAPCIKRCDADQFFDSHKIQLYEPMLRRCFETKSGSIMVNPLIKKKEAVNP